MPEKRKIISYSLIAIMIISFAAPFIFTNVQAAETTTIKIVIDGSHGEISSKSETLTAQLVANLTAKGYEVVVAKGGINSTVLENATALLVGAVYGANFTDAEILAIKNWYNTGNKFIWVNGDSDYSGNYIVQNSNKILEEIGAHLRVEPTSVEDPESNCGAGYRVVANVTNSDPTVAPIVENVTKVLFHGPSILYGVKDNGDPVALENTTLPNVYWIMKTSPAGIIVDHDLVPPVAHTANQEGSFVIFAVELAAGPSANNVVMVSGAAGYGDYEPMYSDLYHDVPLTGSSLVKQAIDYGLTKCKPAMGIDPMIIMAAVGAVVVVVIIAAVLKKK